MTEQPCSIRVGTCVRSSTDHTLNLHPYHRTCHGQTGLQRATHGATIGPRPCTSNGAPPRHAAAAAAAGWRPSIAVAGSRSAPATAAGTSGLAAARRAESAAAQQRGHRAAAAGRVAEAPRAASMVAGAARFEPRTARGARWRGAVWFYRVG